MPERTEPASLYRERPAQTLYDYAADYQWIQMLGWTDEQLKSVLVHEQAPVGDESVNLAVFGGTSLGVSARVQVTSADTRSIPNMWVTKSTSPLELYQQLKDLVDRGGPSGYNLSGKFGEVGEADFPPTGPARPPS